MAELDMQLAMLHPVTLGVALGLTIGKPIGITLFTWITTKILRVNLIAGVTWPMIVGVGFLGGIGFTMSLFIAALSFSVPVYQEYAKMGIIIGSILSALFGYILLRVAGHNAE